jgi:hypothetical protein
MEGEAGAPGVDAEKLDPDGDTPIRERGLLKVSDIVLVEGDPVVADENFAAGVGMGGVDVVLQRRGEQAGAKDGQPEESEDDKRGPGALSE